METTIARNYVTIEDEMRRSYLDYAMSVIVGRALPDVRDGLKPVHRRALWSMHELGNTHNKPYKKSARVVGDCFVAGTLVHTEHGLKPIEDIEPGENVLMPNGYLSRVVEAYHNPPSSLVQVILANGQTIKVTPGQKFRVLADDLSVKWERADNLAGKLVLAASPRALGTPEKSASPERTKAAYMAGLTVAEGFLTDRGRSNRVGIGMIDKEPLDFVAAYCQEKSVNFSLSLRKPQKSYYQPLFTLRFSGLPEATAICGNTAASKQVPEWVLADRCLFAPFLAGFVDGDGHIRATGSQREIVLATTARQLASQLQTMLADCGIHVHLSENVREHTPVHWLPLYIVTPVGENASRLARMIAPYLQVKRKREAASDLTRWQRRTLNNTTECLPSAAIFAELSQHHLGGGWYQDVNGQKFRSGIKYPTGAKIRYSKDLSEKTISYRQIETWGLIAKLERIGSPLAARLRYLIETYSVLAVKSVTDCKEQAETFDIQIADDSHELLVQGCAASNCLGKYHPHGDSAVYDTIVRMAQDFSLRYPLVDGQGNFGCFTGDTKIMLADGARKTFAELAELPPDETFEVIAIDKAGRPLVCEGRHSRITRQQAELMQVTLESGATICCTPDHRFLLRDGTYKDAQHLTAADDLMPRLGAKPRPLCATVLRRSRSDAGRGVWYQSTVAVANNFSPLKPRRVVAKKRLQLRADVYDITVDVHHNFLLADGVFVHNSIDGDNPAAQRYTEVRMARIANELLADIEKETVNFQPNYDESLSEPTVLPVRFPQLLVNGSEGIAVGMATKVAPHNLTEIVNATIELVRNPMATLADLMKHVSGPDFPTGAFIYGRSEIRKAYTEGRGILQLRARAGIDRIEHGNTSRDAIVVTEIPYQVNKAKLLERIGELVNEKRIEGIYDLRDESDREGMRIVIELKRDAMPQVVLNNLYKMTPMQTSFGIINLAIVNGQPRVLNLRQMLEAFVEFRREVVRRRTQYELKRAQARAHILEGLTKAIDALDYIVALIRNAPSVDAARQWLTGNNLAAMAEVKNWRGVPGDRKPAEFLVGLQDAVRRLKFSELQAQAILDLQLRRLSALERQKITDELEALLKVIGELEAILRSDQLLRNVIIKELESVRKDYGDARRTQIVDESVDMSIEDLIADEEVAITVTNSGYIKRTPVTTYQKQGRGGKGRKGAMAKGTDFVEHLFIASTHAYLMVFTDDGQVYKVKVHELPDAAAASRGKALVNLINIPSTRKLARVMPVREFSEGVYVVLVTRKGVIKKTALSEFQNIRAMGINAINVDEGDELLDVVLTDGTKQIFIATHEGQAVRFEESELRALGRATRGVRGADLREDDYVVSVCAISPEGSERMLSISEQGYGKQTKASDYRLTRRGGKGVINMKTNEKTGKVVAVFPVEDESEIMIISQQGKLIRLEAATIRETGRSASGVRLIRTDDEDIVTSASLLDIAAAVVE